MLSALAADEREREDNEIVFAPAPATGECDTQGLAAAEMMAEMASIC